MPSKNSTKVYSPESMYHIYNRGVDKRIIFEDEKDYAVFLSFLKYALLSEDEISRSKSVDTTQISDSSRFNLRRAGLFGKVELVSFCLMPNHFHLLLYQYDVDGITRLMRSVATGYSLYFNKRHKRSGTLFQGRYKARMIDSQEYWDHISRYIHLNPLEISDNLTSYQYSSYPYFVGDKSAKWLRPGLVLDGFKSKQEYRQFVIGYIPKRKELKDIEHLLADK